MSSSEGFNQWAFAIDPRLSAPLGKMGNLNMKFQMPKSASSSRPLYSASPRLPRERGFLGGGQCVPIFASWD
jgi:hypothetical protein